MVGRPTALDRAPVHSPYRQIKHSCERHPRKIWQQQKSSVARNEIEDRNHCGDRYPQKAQVKKSQTWTAKAEKKRRPSCVEQKTDKKNRERCDATAISPDNPARYRDSDIKDRPCRREKPARRTPPWLGQTLIPDAGSKESARRRGQKTYANKAEQSQYGRDTHLLTMPYNSLDR